MMNDQESPAGSGGWTRRSVTHAGLGAPLLVLPDSARAAAAADRPWHHVPGGGFRNPPGSPERGGSAGDWWSFLYRRLVAPAPKPELPDGHVLDTARALAGLQAHDPAPSITWLGHASFLIRLGGLTLLTDPYLSEHASPLPPFGPRRFAPAALRPGDLPRVDLLLLSHNHYDHLDLPAVAEIAQRWRPRVIAPLGLTRYLERPSFTEILELDWYQSLDLDGLRLTATPAIHFSKRTLFDRNQTLWCGFRLDGRHRSVWFAGDTAFGPVFEEIGQRLGRTDLALVPIGAYEPRELMRGSHCTPEEAVRISRAVGASSMCGMHWGTIMLTDEPPFEPPGRFRAAAAAAGYPPEAAWVMAIGETRSLEAASVG
jgi:L-ascorbate metabolism protein UlaG (beta-lactamase superfamily)